MKYIRRCVVTPTTNHPPVTVGTNLYIRRYVVTPTTNNPSQVKRETKNLSSVVVFRTPFPQSKKTKPSPPTTQRKQHPLIYGNDIHPKYLRHIAEGKKTQHSIENGRPAQIVRTSSVLANARTVGTLWPPFSISFLGLFPLVQVRNIRPRTRIGSQ